MMEFNKCLLVRALQPVVTHSTDVRACVKNFDVQLNADLTPSVLYIPLKAYDTNKR
jgi:hypothetical protein